MSEANPIERFGVSATSESETKTIVEARDFEFVVDEPADLGGTNAAPNPVEYLIGAWTGCLNVVVHTIADEQDIEVAGVGIDIEGDLDPRKFLGLADDVRAGYQDLEVRIEIESDADDKQLEQLVEAVEKRCPVGDNIENPTPTDIQIDAVE